MSVYGHLHLSLFFRPLLETTEKGVLYKGNLLLWDQIETVTSTSASPLLQFLRMGGTPKAYLKFKNGVTIKIDGRIITKQGVKLKRDTCTGTSFVFSSLIRKLKSKIT
jgi:hypothetical protein